jgi:hypothetical protein
MFVSQANMICVSGYLSGDAKQTEGEPESKKRKVPSNYVSSLFKNLEQVSIPLISRAVLAGYVNSKRSKVMMEAETSGGEDDYEFEFFRSLINATRQVSHQIDLWNELSALRIYKLRDEKYTEIHRKSLEEFLARTGMSDSSDCWRGFATVLSIDPIHFTDTVTDRALDSIGEQTEEMISGLKILFRSYATKGMFSDLIDRILEAIESKKSNLFSNIQLDDVIADVIGEVSSHDLILVYEKLFNQFDGRPDSPTCDFALTFLVPLVGQQGVNRLTENMFPKISLLFEAKIRQLIDFPKFARHNVARLVIAIVDGLRRVQVAQAIPVLVGESPSYDAIETGLDWVARKDSRLRASALIRMALLVPAAEIKIDDLNECKKSKETIVNFVSESHLNRKFFASRFGTPEIMNEPEEVVRASLSADDTLNDVESLIQKSCEIIKQYSDIIFTPISLRLVGSFPIEVISIETSWGNKDIEIMNKLVEVFEKSSDDTQRVAILYGLTVMVEEMKRNGQLKPPKCNDGVTDIMNRVNNNLGSISYHARARWFLAIHQLVPGTIQDLILIAHELLYNCVRTKSRIDCAYFCTFQALVTGIDKRKIRSPWWTSQMSTMIMIVRGLIGSTISGIDDEARIAAANYVCRIWKIITESFSTEKFFKISKSLVIMVGEYIRLSHRIVNAECTNILDKGCCLILNKLSKEEREHCHALLGSQDRESLRRIHEMFEKNYKFTGQV